MLSYTLLGTCALMDIRTSQAMHHLKTLWTPRMLTCSLDPDLVVIPEKSTLFSYFGLWKVPELVGAQVPFSLPPPLPPPPPPFEKQTKLQCTTVLPQPAFDFFLKKKFRRTGLPSPDPPSAGTKTPALHGLERRRVSMFWEVPQLLEGTVWPLGPNRLSSAPGHPRISRRLENAHASPSGHLLESQSQKKNRVAEHAKPVQIFVLRKKTGPTAGNSCVVWIGCQHLQVMMTHLLQKHWEWQEDKR